MDYTTLKILHMTGLSLAFMGLAGILAYRVAGPAAPFQQRIPFHLSHGLGMLLLIITGFGMAAKLGIESPPVWVLGKLVCWLLAAVSAFLAIRFSRFSPYILVFFALLVSVAAWLAISKPFL